MNYTLKEYEDYWEELERSWEEEQWKNAKKGKRKKKEYDGEKDWRKYE